MLKEEKMCKKLQWGGFFLLVGCLLLSACRHNPNESRLNLAYIAPPCRIDCNSDLSDTLFALPEEMEHFVYRFLKQEKGESKRVVLRADFPEEWQLEAAIETPYPDLFLWVVRNSGEVSHKLLMTVNDPGNGVEPEVITGMLVAYNVAEEQPNRIESEMWTAEVDAECHLCIHKKYEVLYSMDDTTHADRDNLLQEVTDCFHIDGNGQIFFEKPQFMEYYRAVVQFMDTAESGLAVDDAWLENAMTMQEYLEPEGICFMEVFQHFDEVLLTDYHGEVLDKVDISSFLKTYGKGYLLLEKGKKPRFLHYGPAETVLRKNIFEHWHLLWPVMDDENWYNVDE